MGQREAGPPGDSLHVFEGRHCQSLFEFTVAGIPQELLNWLVSSVLLHNGNLGIKWEL